jgi:hypothetical protein
MIYSKKFPYSEGELLVYHDRDSGKFDVRYVVLCWGTFYHPRIKEFKHLVSNKESIYTVDKDELKKLLSNEQIESLY